MRTSMPRTGTVGDGERHPPRPSASRAVPSASSSGTGPALRGLTWASDLGIATPQNWAGISDIKAGSVGGTRKRAADEPRCAAPSRDTARRRPAGKSHRESQEPSASRRDGSHRERRHQPGARPERVQGSSSVDGLARRTPDWSPAKTEWVRADVADGPEELVPHLRGADAVVHLAWRFQAIRDSVTTWTP